MKTKTLLILILSFLLLISLSYALDLCKDTVEINTNCTMLTPNLNCTSYTYDIYNLSGSAIVQDGELLQLNGSLYQFNFTEEEGDYIVKLCDETTREVRVTSEDSGKMIIAFTIIIPMILGLFFLIGSATMSEEHNVLKIFLFLLSILTFFTSGHFALLGIVKFYNFPALQNAIGSTVYWVGWMFALIITYFLIYLIIKIVHTAAQRKKERLEY
jgi:hypothetical protein